MYEKSRIKVEVALVHLSETNFFEKKCFQSNYSSVHYFDDIMRNILTNISTGKCRSACICRMDEKENENEKSSLGEAARKNGRRTWYH